MELIIKSNDEKSIQKIIDFANKLNVFVEKKITAKTDEAEKEAAKQWLLNFNAASDKSSFGDAAEWEREQREDRDLPFPR